MSKPGTPKQREAAAAILRQARYMARFSEDFATTDRSREGINEALSGWTADVFNNYFEDYECAEGQFEAEHKAVFHLIYGAEAKYPGAYPENGYRVWLINFGYYTDFWTDSRDGAINEAKRTGFECRIDCDGNPVATWSPIGSTRNLD